MAYSADSQWRNRDLFINGRDEIASFLESKYAKELNYKLCKELWAYTDNKIAVRFAYEWHDISGQWWRSYGNENWEFDENGLMKVRFASINDVAIEESERKLTWEGAVRPDDFSRLSEMGL
jgi:nuclear transport factor 2 (NTF2) superfamily protein